MVQDLPKSKEVEEEVNFLWAYKSIINVRTQPNATSAKIGQLSDGDSVAVLMNENGWYQIKLASGDKGYVRSDLLAPKDIAIFPRAVHFVDSLREMGHTGIFFDKQDQHKKIYISYPDVFYTSSSRIDQATQQLVKRYQQSVYAGTVTAVVLKPNTNDMYNKYEYPGIINADCLLPVVPFGLLDTITMELPEKIILVIKIPDSVDDGQFLPAARQMATVFPLPYSHVEFRFLAANGTCRFWFLEDASGEHYQYSHCP